MLPCCEFPTYYVACRRRAAFHFADVVTDGYAIYTLYVLLKDEGSYGTLLITALAIYKALEMLFVLIVFGGPHFDLVYCGFQEKRHYCTLLKRTRHSQHRPLVRTHPSLRSFPRA